MRPVTWLKSLHDRWKSFNERKLHSGGEFFFIFWKKKKNKLTGPVVRSPSGPSVETHFVSFLAFPVCKREKHIGNQKQQLEQSIPLFPQWRDNTVELIKNRKVTLKLTCRLQSLSNVLTNYKVQHTSWNKQDLMKFI